MPSVVTMPWMLQGMPSSSGATRTRSHRAARSACASAAVSGLVTQRTSVPPPLKPARASPDHTVPAPASSRAAAASSALRSPATTTSDGAHTTPACSNSVSLVVLSSRATHSGRRAPKAGRPATDLTVSYGATSTSASPSGSKVSTASRTASGGSAIARSTMRKTSIVPGVRMSSDTHVANVGSGRSPVPTNGATSRQLSAPRAWSWATVGVAPATGNPARMIRRPATSDRAISVSRATTVAVAGSEPSASMGGR